MRVAEGGVPAGADAAANGEGDVQSLLDGIADWLFVLAPDGRILQLNAAARDALGPAAAIGAPFSELWQVDQAAAVEAAIAAGERLMLVARANLDYRIDFRFSRGTFGGRAACFGVGRPLLNLEPRSRAVSEPALDDEFRRTVELLARQLPSYRTLLDASMFGMALFDLHGRYLDVNAAFERLIGYARSEVIGKNSAALGIISDNAVDRTRGQILTAGSTQLSVYEIKRRDGAMRRAMQCTSRVELEGATLALTVAFDMTDYLLFQQALRDQDQKFRALFDNVADAMFFTRPDGTFFEVNPAACRQLGYTRAELIGMSVTQIAARQGFDVERAMRGFAETGYLSYETRHRRKDGSVFPVELTLTKIEHAGQYAVAAIARDLSTVKRTQDELRETRDRLQATLQALPDLVVEYDADGVIAEFYSARQLLRVPPEQLLGRNVRDITNAEVSAGVLGAIHEALQSGTSVGTQFAVEDGRWMELSAARRGDIAVDQKPRVIAIVRDITERKQREHELERRNDELMRFSYTVSHDLKGPLVTIKSFIGYLLADLEAGNAAKVQADIAHIRKAAERMDELMEDLLQLSRVGRKQHPPAQLSLQQLVQDACELLAGRIATCNAEVVPPEPNVLVWGDRVRLLEVLQNLLDNAIKFSEGRPVAGRVRVWVTATQRGQEVVISVRDRGIGIDPRFQHKLFGLFEKLHNHAEGTGIGLALVKRIVELHGGRVWVESAGEGCGTTVSFTLPTTPGGRP